VLIGTVVLSFAAVLGLSAAAFSHLFGFAGADTAVPLFAFVLLVALGIDYNIFLMTRVCEEAKKSGIRQGAVTALGRRRSDHLGRRSRQARPHVADHRP
jgi:RND superfamily putative drug exporter